MALALLGLASLVSAHTIITYPGWRGDNLHSNGTVYESSGLGIGPNNTFPYGMQWMYPCGGMPMTTNRTLWPVGGGGVAVQPGWFQGHPTAFFYINLGIGTVPANYSLNMVPVFQIVGPSKYAYPGGFCLPQVPLPQGYLPNVGDNATIQVVEAALHGAALFSCVDITFADPADVEQLSVDNCANSSDIGFNLVFTSTSLTSSAVSVTSPPMWLAASIPLLAALAWAAL
jgi:hypothetical protein